MLSGAKTGPRKFLQIYSILPFQNVVNDMSPPRQYRGGNIMDARELSSSDSFQEDGSIPSLLGRQFLGGSQYPMAWMFVRFLIPLALCQSMEAEISTQDFIRLSTTFFIGFNR